MSDNSEKPRGRMRVGILPSLVTLGNLVAGFAAIGVCAHAQFLWKIDKPEAGTQWFAYAGLLILAAMVFDALDGKVARMANQTSEFGAQLDSLCDMVSFGIAPAYIVFLEVYSRGLFNHWRLAWGCALIFAICAALRLARFNVETTPDEEAHRFFHGLPTPAAAGVIASLAIFEWRSQEEALWAAIVMPFASPLLGVLMVSRVRYVHLVNMLFRDRKPFIYLAMLVFIVFTLMALPALPGHYQYVLLASFVGYCVSGPAALPWAFIKRRHRKKTAKLKEPPPKAPAP